MTTTSSGGSSANSLFRTLLSMKPTGKGSGISATGAAAVWIIPNIMAIGRHGSDRYDIHFTGTLATNSAALPGGSNIIDDSIETPSGSGKWTQTTRISLDDSTLPNNPEAMAISVVAEAAINLFKSGHVNIPDLLTALQSPNDFLGLIIRRNVLSINDQKGITYIY